VGQPVWPDVLRSRPLGHHLPKVLAKFVRSPSGELLARVTEDPAGGGPRVLTPDMNRFVHQGAERANLRLTIPTREGDLTILMATHQLRCDDAFAVLSTTSQRVNRKLRDLAGEIVTDPASARSCACPGLSGGRAIAASSPGVPVTGCG
jgi:hypothetical protein